MSERGLWATIGVGLLLVWALGFAGQHFGFLPEPDRPQGCDLVAADAGACDPDGDVGVRP